MLNATPGLSCGLPGGAFYAFASCEGLIGRTTPAGTLLATDEEVAGALLRADRILVRCLRTDRRDATLARSRPAAGATRSRWCRNRTGRRRALLRRGRSSAGYLRHPRRERRARRADQRVSLGRTPGACHHGYSRRRSFLHGAGCRCSPKPSAQISRTSSPTAPRRAERAAQWRAPVSGQRAPCRTFLWNRSFPARASRWRTPPYCSARP